MKYEYRVVPFMGQLSGGVVTDDGVEKVSQDFGDLISRTCKNGWEFYRVDRVSVRVAPSCVGAFLGQKNSYVDLDQVVFRRAK